MHIENHHDSHQYIPSQDTQTTPLLDLQQASDTTVSLHLQLCRTPRASTYFGKSLPAKPFPSPFNADENNAMQMAIGTTGSNPSERASSALGKAQLQRYWLSVVPQSEGPLHLLPQTPIDPFFGGDVLTTSVTFGGSDGIGPQAIVSHFFGQNSVLCAPQVPEGESEVP